MMASLGSLQLVRLPVTQSRYVRSSSVPIRRLRPVQKDHFLGVCGLRHVLDLKTGRRLGQESWCGQLWGHLRVSSEIVPQVNANSLPVTAASSAISADEQIKKIALLLVQTGSYVLNRTIRLVQLCPPLVPQITPAFGLMIFTVFGLGPTMRFLRSSVFKRNDRKWDGSRTQNIMSSYMRPILLWIGVTVICRALDPVVLSTEASQAIKQRFVSFVRSLSTVLAFAFCTASLTQQVQKFMMEHQNSDDARSVGVQFIGNTVYTSVWVAAVCLFMELLGFSTQKWITAGGFGTVLLTLAGREIFTNFLSSIMIHATRPFVESEWIQTKIEGQEVSGTVEHVGWWSPTVIRGDDREAVHIPNHKFSVSVVRNLSQKTHWRIKTHFGISHLDVNKINDIVSDMRKIMSKHPHVEQQRLHRRAFFDNIDPENQALLILVSCFVKTSHFEEYLSVKETILLNMLKVISHHNARLATPIRSVQRVMDESETKGAPFRDMRASAEAQRRPYLLMEAEAMADDDDDNDDISNDITRLSAELAKATKGATPGSSEGNRSVTATQVRNSEDTLDSKESKAKVKPKESAPVGAEASAAARASPTTMKAQLDGLDSMGLNPKDITLLGAALKDKPPAKIQEGPVEKQPSKPSEGFVGALKDKAPAKVQEGTVEKPVKTPKSPVDSNLQTYASTKQQKSTPEQHDASSKASVIEHIPAKAVDKVSSNKKAPVEEPVVTASDHVVVKATDSVPSMDAAEVGQDDESTQAGRSITTANDDDPWRQPAASHKHDSERLQPRPQSVENNLVLGVAIDGPKRTLPLDNEIVGLGEPRDYVTSGSGNNSKERKEPSTQSISPGAVANETRDRER